jgi:signal transduction histidine kinase
LMNLGDTLRSTTVRWSAAIAIALLVQSATLCGLFYWWTVRQATTEVDNHLVADCSTFSKLPPRALNAAINGMIAADIHRVRLAGLFSPAGNVLAGNIATLPAVLMQSHAPFVIGLVRNSPPSRIPDPSRTISCPAAAGGYLVFAEDMDSLTHLQLLIGRALVLITAPAVAIAIFLGVVLSLRAQNRFRIVRSAVEGVMAGQLERRLPVHSTIDPFDRLSASVNAMLDRLEEAVNDLRALGDDIAHELRTPLMRLRARLERGYRDADSSDELRLVEERGLRDVDHALSIVSSILRLREIDEARRGANFALVDAGQVLRDAAELYLPCAEMRNITLSLGDMASVQVMADHDLLMEAVCNLLDNSVKFTPLGGRVSCELKVCVDGTAAFRIVDTGPGIGLTDRDAVLRRFHRGSGQSRVAGHGIGLTLVAAIVRLHGFTLHINDVPAGCDIEIRCRTAAPGHAAGPGRGARRAAFCAPSRRLSATPPF